MDFDPRALFNFLRRKQLRYGGRADLPPQRPHQTYDTGNDYAKMIAESHLRGMPPRMNYVSAQPYSVEVGEPEIEPQYNVEVGEPVLDAGSQMRDVASFEPDLSQMAYHAARKQRPY